MERDGKNYLRTERAHYMCPNMCFGILARIRAAYDAEKLAGTVAALQAAHPFLRSLIAEEAESGALYYQERERLTIPVAEKPDPDAWRRDYDELVSQGWNVRENGLLRLLCYPAGEAFSILFLAHHLLCDGRGLYRLAEEFARCYVRGETPAFVRERLIAAQDDLPAGSALPLVSRAVVDEANRRWDREGRRVSYERYLAFERAFIRQNPVRREVLTLEGAALAKLLAQCRQRGVSVNDWLLAKMMLEEGTDKVVMAADLRDRLACYRPGAMGNYATAFSLSVSRRGKDPMTLAEEAARRVSSVRKQPKKELLVLSCCLRLRPELLDAAAISALGDFESAAGAFAGTRMFGYGRRDGHGVTNLGRAESEVIAEAVFIPPASPANSCTWGVLTVNGKMKLCAVTAER